MGDLLQKTSIHVKFIVDLAHGDRKLQRQEHMK